mmetsp:Transcript_89505/g.258153  ORF Transcript_89505/g.258153 Transcript_89505/m.258153 type:complete len:117 (+) Transcript_89505:52-402(+)
MPRSPSCVAARGIVLTCENFHWAERAPIAEGGYRPTAQRRAALNEAASNEQLSLLYSIHPFWDAGARVLELQESAMCHELQHVSGELHAAALQSLGFAAKYGPTPLGDECSGAPSC